MTVSFDISDTDAILVTEIVNRAAKLIGRRIDKLSLRMDLVACHANGCPMDFARLANSDDFNLSHDVFGISRHIDRETGALTRCFLPRFTAKTAAASVEG